MHELAHALGRACRGDELILLRGEMGAGKTTFTRALGEGLRLRAPGEVCSPTYTVCMTHEGPLPLVHLDLFRLGDMGEGAPVRGGAFEALGLAYDALPPPGSVLVVEWSELWEDPPTDRLELALRRPAENPAVRALEARATGPRHADLLARWAPPDLSR